MVAFRASSQGWTQVPVQVDERKTTTVAAIYDLPPNQWRGTSTNVSVNVSTETVRTHMVNLLHKLEVDSRLKALVFAVKHGLVTIEAGS